MGFFPRRAKRPWSRLLLRIYRTMRLTRLVDERMTTLQRQGLISFALSSLGEEACAVASAAAFGEGVTGCIRSTGRRASFFGEGSIEPFVHQMFGDAKDLGLGGKCRTTLATGS